MMTLPKKASLNIDELTEILSEFAIDRTEMYNLLTNFPSETDLNRTTIEYEIQILRILGVGWGISYFIHDELLKQALSESYWNSIQEFANNLSSISSVSMSQEFNYFDVIKERLGIYLAETKFLTGDDDPATVIGPKFAELCDHPNDAVVIWLGCKMFQAVFNQLKTYLSGVEFINPNSASNNQSETNQ